MMVNYSVKLNVIFSSDTTGWTTEKINEIPSNNDLYRVASDPSDVALMGNDALDGPTSEKIPASTTCDVIADCGRLSATQLRQRYKGEATSHRNMKGRRKTTGAIVHPEFADFRSFLRHVGPKPTKRSTLDRIDNTDPEYGPGKVRWADRRTQNSNKGDSLTFYNDRTGEVFTTSRLAKLQGVKVTAIRKRFQRGWSDAEIIEGRRHVEKIGIEKEQPQPVPERFRQYEARERPGLCRTSFARPKSAQQIMFEQERELVLHGREQNGGVDDLPPTPDQWIAEFEEWAAGEVSLLSLTARSMLVEPDLREQLDSRYRKSTWPNLRPHVEWQRIAPEQQVYIEEIDPEWVEQQKAKAALKATMMSVL